MKLSECTDPAEFMITLDPMWADPANAAIRPYIDYWILNRSDIEAVYWGGRKKRFLRNLRVYVSSNMLGETIPDQDIPAYGWMAEQLDPPTEVGDSS